LRSFAGQVPLQVDKFARSLPERGVAVIGCRCQDEISSLDCCEYDLAVFSEERRESQVIRLDGQTVELLYFSGRPENHIAADLYGMKIVRDTNRFTLASLARSMTEEKFTRSLAASGRKSLVSSLFCLRAPVGQNDDSGVLGAMWAKIAAYRFVSGVVAISGSRPMPLHEMDQSRRIEAADHIADGLQASLECIGTERATRPAISRSLAALRELKSKDYDRDLVLSKAEMLQSRQMLADCYYYIGKMASESLAARNEKFHRKYSKLVQLALDLTGDAQQVEKLRRRIFAAATAVLKQ
jgi:hypothetical protein